jgi:hypothetical protein
VASLGLGHSPSTVAIPIAVQRGCNSGAREVRGVENFGKGGGWDTSTVLLRGLGQWCQVPGPPSTPHGSLGKE